MIADFLFWLAQTVGASSARVGDGNEITCPAQWAPSSPQLIYQPQLSLLMWSWYKLSPDTETDV